MGSSPSTPNFKCVDRLTKKQNGALVAILHSACELCIIATLQLADSNVSMIRKSFDVIIEHTARELNGESCMALEDAPPPKQQIVVSRSLDQRVT